LKIRIQVCSHKPAWSKILGWASGGYLAKFKNLESWLDKASKCHSSQIEISFSDMAILGNVQGVAFLEPHPLTMFSLYLKNTMKPNLLKKGTSTKNNKAFLNSPKSQ
jgi:hypothetical protein